MTGPRTLALVLAALVLAAAVTALLPARTPRAGEDRPDRDVTAAASRLCGRLTARPDATAASRDARRAADRLAAARGLDAAATPNLRAAIIIEASRRCPDDLPRAP